RRQNPQTSNWLQYGNTYLDTDAIELYVENEKIELTSTEYTLIELFYQNPNRVYSRQEILRHITDEDEYVVDRSVYVHVKNLRLKMAEAGKLIKTHRGIGYGLNRNLAKV